MRPEASRFGRRCVCLLGPIESGQRSWSRVVVEAESAIVDAVPGGALGWLDDTRVLVQTYVRDVHSSRWRYEASRFYVRWQT
ncbi:hypothetical protein [Sorangium sp. So ce233]|uniref:hypothetical protein n=1 Tax=Sorangium sp. So ce233 TaxID=3133290 RepID=UPI003F5F068E